MAKGTRGGKRGSSSTSTPVVQRDPKDGKNWGTTRGQLDYYELQKQINNDPSVNTDKGGMGTWGNWIGNDYEAHMIQVETGVDKETAWKYQRAITDYTSPWKPNYKEYTAGNRPDETKAIDEMLSKMGTYDGEIYRGMALGKRDAAQFLSNAKVGAEIQMKGLSSWTSDKSIAERFRDTQNGVNQNNKVGVVLRTKNKSGVGIAHISSTRDEAEVLVNTKARWKVTGVTKTTKSYGKNNDKTRDEYIIDLEEI